MPFRIVGEHPDRLLNEQRGLAASAAVLAMKWVRDGVQRVVIEAEGHRYDVDAFRNRYLGPRARRRD
jgi:hypothetical protein